jgi:hypothetical protein
LLLPKCGNRLHDTEYKPGVCRVFPQEVEEVRAEDADGGRPGIGKEFADGNGCRREIRSAAETGFPA